MNSEQLQKTQKALEELVKLEIDDPMTDYAEVTRMMKVIKMIDSKRRAKWHDEKFGPYEEMVDEVIDNTLNFTADDIPF